MSDLDEHDDESAHYVQVPVDLLNTVSEILNSQKLEDIEAVLVVLASRIMVLGADNDVGELHHHLLNFVTSIYNETVALAEKMGVGEPRQ